MVLLFTIFIFPTSDLSLKRKVYEILVQKSEVAFHH